MKNRISGLNIIKIIATVLILMHHYQQFMYFWMEGKVNFVDGNFYFGYIVELFFMISGILAWNSYENMGESLKGTENVFCLGSFGDYMKRKFIRFFPTCFISTTFLFVMQWILYFTTGRPTLWDVPTVLDYFLSILFLDTGWGLGRFIGATHITWYISVLLILYAVFWCVCYICRKNKKNVVYVSFALMILGIGLATHEELLFGKDYPFFNVEVGRGLMGFFLGIVVFYLLQNYERVMKVFSYVGIPMVALALIYDYVTCGSIQNPLIGSTYLSVVFIMYPAVITICMTSTLIKRISDIKVMDYVEKLSFSAYIWQFNFLLIIMRIRDDFAIQINQGYKAMIIYVIAVFVICIPIYQFIEIPLTKAVKNRTTN